MSTFLTRGCARVAIIGFLFPIFALTGVGAASAGGPCGSNSGMPGYSVAATKGLYEKWVMLGKSGDRKVRTYNDDGSIDDEGSFSNAENEAISEYRYTEGRCNIDYDANSRGVSGGNLVSGGKADLSMGERYTNQIRTLIAPWLLLGLSLASISFLFRREALRFLQFAGVAVGCAVFFYVPGIVETIAHAFGA